MKTNEKNPPPDIPSLELNEVEKVQHLRAKFREADFPFTFTGPHLCQCGDPSCKAMTMQLVCPKHEEAPLRVHIEGGGMLHVYCDTCGPVDPIAVVSGDVHGTDAPTLLAKRRVRADSINDSRGLD